MMKMLHGVNFCALAASLALPAPGPARPGDITVGFDDLASGARVATQYRESAGVEFVTDPLFGSSEGVFPEVIAAEAGSANRHVASIRSPGGGELRENVLWGKLGRPTRRVRLRVGSFGPPTDTTQVRLFAVDAAGGEVARDEAIVVGGAGYGTTLEVSAPDDVIAFFVVRGPFNAHVAVDDINFDVPAMARPDFGLTRSGPPSFPVLLVPGGTAAVTLTLHRTGGSTGAVTLAASSLPSGVEADFAPPAATGPDGSTVLMTLTATSGAPAAPLGSVTVTGTPASGAGSIARSLVVPLVVRGAYDARVTGIEVTQGVQEYDLPRPPAAGPAAVSYTGVMLAENGKTVVRVFSDLRVAPPAGRVDGAEALLFGERNGAPLPGSPLKPHMGTRTLRPGPGNVPDAARSDPDGGYTFTLPPAWTHGSIDLRAQLFTPAPLLAAYTEGQGPAYRDNDALTLRGVGFTPTRGAYVWPVEMLVEYEHLPAPPTVFADAVNLAPLGEGQLYVPDTYGGTIDITDIARIPPDIDLALFGPSESFKAGVAATRLLDRAEELNLLNPGRFVVGVYPGRAGIRSRTQTGCPNPNLLSFIFCDKASVAVVDASRPILAVAHELGHMFGRVHAGEDCPNVENAAPWPPDNKGFLQGVGLDRRGGPLRPGALTWGPYDIIAPPRADTAGQRYDFMSYCARDANAWVSARGWNEALQLFRTDVAWFGWPLGGSAHGARAADPAPTPSPTRIPARRSPALLVRGITLPSGAVYLTQVGPSRYVPTRLDTRSAYRLVVRDRRGRVLSDAPVHAAGDPDGGDVLVLEGRAPANRAAASVEVTREGVVVARRVRARRAPRVALLAPGRGAVLPGCGEVVVRWRARGESPLLAKVDYSSDDGRSWRPLFSGPDRGQATLAASLFTGSGAARVRVRVNDGFNETVAVSRRLRALGSPPSVRILSPSDSVQVVEGAALYLAGQARDDAQEPLDGERLEWSVAGRPLGSGTSLGVSTLAPGTHRVVLTARDARGRTGSAAVLVTVSPRTGGGTRP